MFFRAFYAIRPLTSPSGLPTNAIYGFMSMVAKLLRDEKPDYMAFCHDLKEPSFRKDMYEGYKANRTEMPEDLIPQIPYIKKIADLLGIASFEKVGFEADDIIGTLTKVGINHGVEVVIVSGDKDFGQLIQKNVFLYDTMKEVKYDSAGVLEKWGIPPEQFIDYLAIVGDASDNVPGVAGIGPKGAQKLLQDFGTLENIYANLDQIKSDSIRNKLIESKDKAFLSKKLVTIVIDMPLSPSLEELKPRPFHLEELKALLTEFNFKAMEKQLFGLDPSQQSAVTVNSPSQIQATIQSSPTNPSEVSVSSPTEESLFTEKQMSVTELNDWIQPGESLWGFENERGIYFAKDEIVVHVSGTLEEIKDLLVQKNPKWLGFDLKKFCRGLKLSNMQVEWDSQLASYVLHAGDMSEFEKTYQQFTQLSLPPLHSAAQLYQAHLNLKSAVQEKLKESGMYSVYSEIELPIAPILLKMEQKGILIDRELLLKQSQGLTQDIEVLQKEIYELAGETFNIASPKQLGHILFDKMKLTVIKKTKTGYSTDSDVLEKLIAEHAIAQKIVDFRELSKLKSTYVDALPLLIDSSDHRIHTTFNQALTSTGRLSSTQPNIQNIPIRTERGSQVRKAFIAAPGCLLLSADYSQIELRILAHITADPGLCRAFENDLDIHSATASEVFGVPLSEVTSELRRTAKAINFGIAYGQGAFGLSEQLGISRSEGSEIIKKYFTKFAKVKEYMESVVLKASEDGFVETLFGRKRYIDELKSKNQMIKKFGERAAINAPIQGTASDLVKMAMIQVSQKVPLEMLLQVHDELIFEGPEELVHQQKDLVLTVMQNVASLKVPLKVNATISNCWGK